MKHQKHMKHQKLIKHMKHEKDFKHMKHQKSKVHFWFEFLLLWLPLNLVGILLTLEESISFFKFYFSSKNRLPTL